MSHNQQETAGNSAPLPIEVTMAPSEELKINVFRRIADKAIRSFDPSTLQEAGVIRGSEAQAAEVAAREGRVDELTATQAQRANALQKMPDYRRQLH